MKNLFFAQSIQSFELTNDTKVSGFVLIAENFDPKDLNTLRIYCNRAKPFYKTPEHVKEIWNMIKCTTDILTKKI